MLGEEGAGGTALKESLGPASMIGGAAALMGVIVGLLLIGHAFKSRARTRVAGTTSAAGVPAGGAAGGAGFDAVRADAEELAQRLASMLDAKAERLEALITRADERIAQLERMEAGAGGSAPLAAGAAEARPAGATKAREEIEQAHREVYELADRGMSVLEISRRVNRPTGQVELILSLRRSAHAAARA